MGLGGGLGRWGGGVNLLTGVRCWRGLPWAAFSHFPFLPTSGGKKLCQAPLCKEFILNSFWFWISFGFHFFTSSHCCCSSPATLKMRIENKLSPSVYDVFDQILKTRDLGPPLIPSELPSPACCRLGSLHFLKYFFLKKYTLVKYTLTFEKITLEKYTFQK